MCLYILYICWIVDFCIFEDYEYSVFAGTGCKEYSFTFPEDETPFTEPCDDNLLFDIIQCDCLPSDTVTCYTP